MPAISTGDAALMRQFPQTVRRYLSAAARDVVFAAQVSSGTIQRDAVSSGVIAIPYTSVTTGAYSDVIAGMTLDIGTTAGGAEIGKVRVRSANAAQILIGETALTLSSGNYLTVRREFRPWQVKPRRFEDYVDAAYPTSFTEYHDYDLAYTNQNTAIPPKANITASGYTLVKPAGFVDAGQTYRTVALSGANSITLAPGASLTAWAWEIGDGTLATGTLSSAAITARFPVGFRYVTLTVTNSNGASSLMRLPIWVHDAASSADHGVRGHARRDARRRRARDALRGVRGGGRERDPGRQRDLLLGRCCVWRRRCAGRVSRAVFGLGDARRDAV